MGVGRDCRLRQPSAFTHPAPDLGVGRHRPVRLDRHRAEPGQEGTSRRASRGVGQLLGAQPRHLQRRVSRGVVLRRRNPKSGVGQVRQRPRAGRLRPDHHPDVEGRPDVEGVRRAASHPVPAEGDARPRDDAGRRRGSASGTRERGRHASVGPEEPAVDSAIAACGAQSRRRTRGAARRGRHRDAHSIRSEVAVSSCRGGVLAERDTRRARPQRLGLRALHRPRRSAAARGRQPVRPTQRAVAAPQARTAASVHQTERPQFRRSHVARGTRIVRKLAGQWRSRSGRRLPPGDHAVVGPLGSRPRLERPRRRDRQPHARRVVLHRRPRSAPCALTEVVADPRTRACARFGGGIAHGDRRHAAGVPCRSEP